MNAFWLRMNAVHTQSVETQPVAMTVRAKMDSTVMDDHVQRLTCVLTIAVVKTVYVSMDLDHSLTVPVLMDTSCASQAV